MSKIVKSGSTNENSTPPDGAKCNQRIQVKLLNHICKTLGKSLNSSKFRIIDLSVFLKIRLFEFEH